jgi:signal peptidase I
MTLMTEAVMSAPAIASSVPAPNVAANAAPERSRLRQWLRIIERGFAVCGVLLIIYLTGFHTTRMISPSMSPTLKGDGKAGSDWVLSERITHWFRAPRRWELIAFRNAEGVQVMKRVVGLPGEHVKLKKDGTFLIDNVAVARPASLASIEYLPWGTLTQRDGGEAGDGYFVLGDDSKDSQDSRWEKSVDADDINGRPWLIIWPLSRFGFVNP